MSHRRYYSDSYTTEFRSRVIERLQHEGQPAVVLDQTYFYPASGGQPCDYGRIGEADVVDVFVRPADDAVVHVLSEPVASGSILATVDWPRRFDHMQQHTGQHLLSQALVRTAGAETVSFHLGSDSSTIDLDLPSLTTDQLEQAESLANEIVWQDRQVSVIWSDANDVGSLPLRKVPEVNGDRLRLINIEDFDLTACGGTHVGRTGEVGLIKILKSERRGENLRVEFLCGQRALLDYRRKNRIVSDLAAELTTGYDQLIQVVSGLQDQLKEASRLVRSQRKQLMGLEAAEMLSAATTLDGIRVVTRVLEEYEPGELRLLANKLVENPRTVALLALTGPKALLLFARSGDAPGDMNSLLHECLAALGSAKGGGTSAFAQGGGSELGRTVLLEALTWAKVRLEEIVRH